MDVNADLYSRLLAYSKKLCGSVGMEHDYMDLVHNIICEGGVNEQKFSEIFKQKKYLLLKEKEDKGVVVYMDLLGRYSNNKPMTIYKQCTNPECNDILPEHEFYLHPHRQGKSTWSICKKCYNAANKGRKREAKDRDRGSYTKLFLKKDRKQLSDSYIKDILKKNGYGKEFITIELIDTKRQSLLNKRLKKHDQSGTK